MNETEDRLYGLMEIAEKQQAVAQVALDGLAKERAALGRERELLARNATALERSVRTAAQVAVKESLAVAAVTGTAAVQTAAEPFLSRLGEVTKEAEQARTALQSVVRWASWRLLGWGAAAVATLLLLLWLAGSSVIWWDTQAIAGYRAQKAVLEGEISDLQARRDEWIAAGLLGRLDRCGPKNRPCVRVDESAGPFGDYSDYRVIRGY